MMYFFHTGFIINSWVVVCAVIIFFGPPGAVYRFGVALDCVGRAELNSIVAVD